MDEDRIQFYRRVETSLSDKLNYERVVYNRADKSITSELILPKADGTPHIFERGVLRENEEGQVSHNHEVYET